MKLTTPAAPQAGPGPASMPSPTTRPSRPLDWIRWSGGLLVFIGLLVGLWAWGSRLVRFVAHQPYFAVQQIVVHTDGRLSQTEIRRWSGIRSGMSVFEVDRQQVETRLLSYPRVARAAVERQLPDAVHIRVEARRPVAVVRGPQLAYLDQHGGCFFDPEPPTVRLDLPYVSGLADLRLDAPDARRVLAGVLRLLAVSRLWREQLSEIHWDRDAGYTLFLAQRQVTVRVGRETWPEKLVRVGRVLETWPVDGPAAVFDARFRNQVVVRPVPTSAQAPTRVGSAEGEEDDV